MDEIINSHEITEHGEVDYYDYRSETFMGEVQEISPLVYSLVSYEADFLSYLQSRYDDHLLPTVCRAGPAL